MARQSRIAYPGAFYHITSRGNEREDIFKSQRDREKFISYLENKIGDVSAERAEVGGKGQKTENGKKIEDERVVRLENLGIKSNLRNLNYKSFEELS